MNTCFPASIAAARWRARNAGGAAVVSTNSRRVTSRGCVGVMTGSWRKEYDAETDERSVGEPPAALGELRIGLVPRGRLSGSRMLAHASRRVDPRAPAYHRRAVRYRDPFGDVAEQVVDAERVGVLRGDRVRLVGGGS